MLQFATLPAQGRNNFSRRLRRGEERERGGGGGEEEKENGSQLCIDDGQASTEVVL